MKKNQKKLFQSLESISSNQAPITVNRSFDKSHGRQIERITSVFNPPNSLPLDWWSGQKFY